MRKFLLLIFAIALAGQALASGLDKMVSLSQYVRCEVDNVDRMDNGDVAIVLDVTFPPKYFIQAAIVELTPIMKYEGGEKEFESKVIQGESVKSNNEVCSFSNGGTFRVKFKMSFEDRLRCSEMVLRAKISVGKKERVCPDIKVGYINKIVPYITKCDNNKVIMDFADGPGVSVTLIVLHENGRKEKDFAAKVRYETALEMRSKNIREHFLRGIVVNSLISGDSSYTVEFTKVVLNTKTGEIEEREGTRKYNRGPYREICIRNEKDGYYVGITYSEGGEISKVWMDFEDDEFSRIQWWSIDDYLKNAKKLNLDFATGDFYSFYGSATYANEKITPNYGLYIFNNGDSFLGDITNKAAGGIYVDGTTTFKADKKNVSGNWLSKYQLTTSQLAEVEKLKYPTDKRNYVDGIMYDKYIENGDKACQSGKYNDAKRWYEQAKEIKDDNNLKEKLNLVNKNLLIAKYGQDKGTKIANKILEIGMTKQMVEEFIDQSYYRVSANRDNSGNSIEIWEYDPDKFWGAMGNGAGNEMSGFFAMLAQSVDKATGNRITKGASDYHKYKYIKFKNNIVAEIRDHSSYEDNNHSYGDDDDFDDLINTLLRDY